jgi:hypothetical protein
VKGPDEAPYNSKVNRADFEFEQVFRAQYGRITRVIARVVRDDHWEDRWADTRIHGTTKRLVAAMFAEEKPSLQPLPLEPFRYYEYGERTVHLDGCVEVEAAYYGAPPGWITRTVQVQWDSPTAGQSNLSGDSLSKVRLPLPPIDFDTLNWPTSILQSGPL